MEILETFELAAEFVGLDPSALPDVSMLEEAEGKAITAFYKLSVLSRAAWKQSGRTLDWTNGSQRKYHAWFFLSDGAASEFSYYDYDFVNRFSYVGSRLVFPTREAVRLVANVHLDLYCDFSLM
ncbi:hypothetical protein LAG90_15765 [Marinilongibacter aquaticus]|uniref:hypothetical protein n=1 Tax=Marinilongibacter aquaticus TaxID=2975157 RepID=UPI0021BDB5BD|nr:hypothetical protein [Marinilongibacter aquaticus]UBM58261.1 hypothetical protein LAG90_15765 [Marinilongibacter aquaticus]